MRVTTKTTDLKASGWFMRFSRKGLTLSKQGDTYVQIRELSIESLIEYLRHIERCDTDFTIEIEHKASPDFSERKYY